MPKKVTKRYLKLLAEHGEMSGPDLVKHVPRPRGDYKDFYPLAALLHAGYIATDSSVERTGLPKLHNTLGYTTQDAAAHLCQFTVPKGQSFFVDTTEYGSWHDFPVLFFLTGPGYLKLEELEEQEDALARGRRDHLIALGIAIVAAVFSSAATSILG